MQLRQQHLAVQAKLDQTYDDHLAGRITDELWLRKSAEWEAVLGTIRRATARHDRASHDYAATGSKILELAKKRPQGKTDQKKRGTEPVQVRPVLVLCPSAGLVNRRAPARAILPFVPAPDQGRASESRTVAKTLRRLRR